MIDGTAIAGGQLTELSGGAQGFTFQGSGSSSGGSSPSPVTIGSGPNSLVLQVSEDAYQGNAMFTVSVDGQQIGGTQTALASHASGQEQAFTVNGTFGSGTHTVSVNFLNDAYGGSSSTDRNLYVDSATINGTAISGATLAEYSPGRNRSRSPASSQLPPERPPAAYHFAQSWPPRVRAKRNPTFP
jgi:hypothetical protein